MSRRPSRPVRAAVTAVAATALLTVPGCSGGDGTPAAPGVSDAAASAAAEPARTSSAGALTEAGARAALLTEADLGDAWRQAENADRWRDELLDGKVDVESSGTGERKTADCQELLDGLRSEGGLLGKVSGPSALAGFQRHGSRLLHRVAAYDRDALDDSMARLRTLPDICDRFTTTGGSGDRRTVEVTEASLPGAGDARQGLRVTVRGKDDDGPATLTVDVAAVRVGSDAFTVTAGGSGGNEKDAVERGVRRGTERLKDVLAGRTPSARDTG
ncbi:lipoprotein [Streptomyces fumigatiscleroticus]|nr:lipoprotein [Streptomyces fumigatiscleroticus]